MADIDAPLSWRMQQDGYLMQINQLRDENAKLRELVRKVEHYERSGCDQCPYEDSCDAGTLYDEDCVMSSEIEREERELGIEVDE